MLRHRRYLSERIEVGPRDLLKSASFFAKKIEKNWNRILQIASKYRNNEDVDQVYNHDLDFGFSILSKERDMDHAIKWLKSNAAPEEKMSLSDYFRYVSGSVSEIQRYFGLMNRMVGVVNDDKKSERIDIPYDIEVGNISPKEAGEIDEMLNLISDSNRRIQSFVKLIKRGERELSRKQQDAWDGKETLPDHEDVETLYHASVKAKKLVRSGFSLRTPNKLVGLGGSTSIGNVNNTGISFTYDLRIAKDIARVFKETSMVARGEIKAGQILDWARRDRIDDLVGAVKSTWGFEGYDDGPSVMGLYIMYLSLQKRRYNPWFGVGADTVYRNFKKVNYRDIGVVVADVNVKDLPRGSHMSGEREIRVTPDRILKIKKVL